MSKISLTPTLSLVNDKDQKLGPEFFILLEYIHETGRLTEAANSLGVSYRHAWNLVNQWSEFFGTELVSFKRGKGASLTELGEKLLWAQQRVSARMGLQLDSLASEINMEINRALKQVKNALTIHASHGYAVAHLPELLKSVPSLQVDLRYMGAAESLASLHRGECDLAGFHLPTGTHGKTVLANLMPLINRRNQRFIHLVTRTQGLFVTEGNPLGIKNIIDLELKGVKFINRQVGSATRMLLDQLIKESNVSSGKIEGYQSEEFTHAAVAAFVASGMANTGFGVQPAAAQFDLDFVPLAKERYIFACHANETNKPEVRELITLIRGNAFNRYVSTLPGYSSPLAGQIMTFREVLALDE